MMGNEVRSAHIRIIPSQAAPQRRKEGLSQSDGPEVHPHWKEMGTHSRLCPKLLRPSFVCYRFEEARGRCAEHARALRR